MGRFIGILLSSLIPPNSKGISRSSAEVAGRREVAWADWFVAY